MPVQNNYGIGGNIFHFTFEWFGFPSREPHKTMTSAVNIYTNGVIMYVY